MGNPETLRHCNASLIRRVSFYHAKEYVSYVSKSSSLPMHMNCNAERMKYECTSYSIQVVFPTASNSCCFIESMVDGGKDLFNSPSFPSLSRHSFLLSAVLTYIGSRHQGFEDFLGGLYRVHEFNTNLTEYRSSRTCVLLQLNMAKVPSGTSS